VGVFSNTQAVNVCSDALRYFQKSADAIVGQKRVLSRNKYREVSRKTEGLNVKVRERITMFYREGVKPNHVRELFAGG